MDTWLIVLIIVAVLVVLALVGLMVARKSKAGTHRKREQAREHLQEAQVRGARAEREHALAEEQAARARRERAEVEERAALTEQEAKDRVAHAERDRSAAEELRAKAEKLAPGVSNEHTRSVQTEHNGPVQTERTEVVRERVDGVPPQRDVVGDDPANRDGYGGGGATRR